MVKTGDYMTIWSKQVTHETGDYMVKQVVTNGKNR